MQVRACNGPSFDTLNFGFSNRAGQDRQIRLPASFAPLLGPPLFFDRGCFVPGSDEAQLVEINH